MASAPLRGENLLEGLQVLHKRASGPRMPAPPTGLPVLVLLLHGDPVVYKWKRTERVWYEARLHTPGRGAVPKAQSALLTELIAGSSIVSPGDSRTKADLAEAMGHKSWADRDLSTLREWLNPLPEDGWAGLTPIPRSRQSLVRLDPHVVDADWWRVNVADVVARKCDDPFDRAYWLYEAERAWVDSARWTPPEVLSRAITALESPNDTRNKPLRERLERFAKRRWQLRGKFLQALGEAGHTSRMVMEYFVWSEFARGDAAAGGDYLLSRANVILDDSDHSRKPIEVIGAVPLQVGSQSTTLREEADSRTAKKRCPPTPPLQAHFAARFNGLFDWSGDVPAEDESSDRGRVELTWDDVAELVRSLIHEIQSESILPQVVVGIARGGAVPASLIAHALRCRQLGWMSISHRDSEGAPGFRNRPYIRGSELPRVRATSVLLVDDIIVTGASCRLAIDGDEGRSPLRPEELAGLRAHYPDARIIVAGLLVHRDGAQARPDDTETWLGGYQIDADSRSRQWVDFPWDPTVQYKSWVEARAH